jgi:hypothetical protein
MLIGKSQCGSTGRSAPYRFRCSRLEKKENPKRKRINMPCIIIEECPEI